MGVGREGAADLDAAGVADADGAGARQHQRRAVDVLEPDVVDADDGVFRTPAPARGPDPDGRVLCDPGHPEAAARCSGRRIGQACRREGGGRAPVRAGVGGDPGEDRAGVVRDPADDHRVADGGDARQSRAPAGGRCRRCRAQGDLRPGAAVVARDQDADRAIACVRVGDVDVGIGRRDRRVVDSGGRRGQAFGRGPVGTAAMVRVRAEHDVARRARAERHDLRDLDPLGVDV